ncbi:MAG: nitroreductase family deazaflavin-dependent oxidoreductase [Austwickia sp.]|jgi:F420H(2)-dependent quinone reductase|nr:nitroreductase family deazaflavin-dependent oxidoreductase [Austwickia sp.]MBK8435208.1 nitroreductase family deazaflavin-dependent oxidoreductase [Austwickia sp.]MBK9101239.1 nitroreductase family deazaflavin-dependent oxidoreductase [Austwickia sp.]
MPLHGEYAPTLTNWVARQLATIDETGDTRSVDIMERRVVVFTVRGARSGLLRRVPLMRVEHEGVYAAVASKGGDPRHPQWFYSMAAHPEVEIHDGTSHADYVAHLADEQERAQWWPRCVEAFPPYAEYQEKADATTGRQIPVFLCVPAQHPHGSTPEQP